MDILGMLKNDSKDLLPEDLALFRTELAVGNYSESYKAECLDIIKQLEKWNEPEKPSKKAPDGNIASVMNVDASKLSPDNVSSNQISFKDQFITDLNVMRISDKYKSIFRQYITTHADFNESFIDGNFSIFEPWEVDAIISEIELSEQFLEKYFSVLDKDKIARYQLFSESFYQKHFSDFDAETVLKKGKNEWRKKENRSNQFSVFLRLKGISY